MTPHDSSPPDPTVLTGEALVPGVAEGPTMVLTQPLSFWGGYDSTSGLIIDPQHPETGRSLAGSVIVMSHAKGSSSSSSVLAQAIRNGTGPAALVLRERDLIVCIGSIIAKELYDLAVPVVVLPAAGFEVATGAGRIGIDASGKRNEARVTLRA